MRRKFATTIPGVFDINYNSYIVKATADFVARQAAGQVFAIKFGGRRDGQPIDTLLPPGGS
jgi:hypothetical protein